MQKSAGEKLRGDVEREKGEGSLRKKVLFHFPHWQLESGGKAIDFPMESNDNCAPRSCRKEKRWALCAESLTMTIKELDSLPNTEDSNIYIYSTTQHLIKPYMYYIARNLLVVHTDMHY